MKLVQCFLKDESGATAIEYGLIAAGIAVVNPCLSRGGQRRIDWRVRESYDRPQQINLLCSVWDMTRGNFDGPAAFRGRHFP